MLVCMLSFRRRFYHNGCIAFLTMPALVGLLVGTMGRAGISLCLFPLGIQCHVSPRFNWQLVSHGSSCIKNLHLSIAVLGALIWPCHVMFGVIRTHETTASSPSCLQYASTTQHLPLQQALLILFPGMDACKMNIVWKQCIILPRPPNICLLLIALVHSLSMSKQNEWPGFRSLCIPPPLFPTRIMLCSIT